MLVIVAGAGMAVPATAAGPRSSAERSFLVDMIGHHAMAVEMAEMAKEKAAHQEIKTMADAIITSQTSEMRRMRSWLDRWYDRRVSGGVKHDADMMRLMDATGRAFEVRWMAMMTVHHTQAVERARAIRKSRLHAQTRKLTADIIRAQSREISQLQNWLVAWYAS